MLQYVGIAPPWSLTHADIDYTLIPRILFGDGECMTKHIVTMPLHNETKEDMTIYHKKYHQMTFCKSKKCRRNGHDNTPTDMGVSLICLAWYIVCQCMVYVYA